MKISEVIELKDKEIRSLKAQIEELQKGVQKPNEQTIQDPPPTK